MNTKLTKGKGKGIKRCYVCKLRRFVVSSLCSLGIRLGRIHFKQNRLVGNGGSRGFT